MTSHIEIVSHSPIITPVNVSQVRHVTADVAKIIYAEFEIPENLEIRLYENTKPQFVPYIGLIRTLFDFATPFLMPNKRRVAKYWNSHRPQFRAIGTYVHELGHSFLFKALSAAIPEYREFYQQQIQFLEMQPIVKSLLNSSDFELNQFDDSSPIAASLKEFASQPKMKLLIEVGALAKPYDELLADLAVALYLENPRVSDEIERLNWQAESGRLIVFLLQSGMIRSKYRNFDTKYEGYEVRDLVSDHTILGPTRSIIWQLYLKHKGSVSKARFMKIIFGIVVEEIKLRIAESRFIDLRIRFEGNVLSQDVNSEEFNRSLIERLMEYKWN